MVRALGAVLMLLAVTTTARGEEPARSHAAASPAMAESAGPLPASPTPPTADAPSVGLCAAPAPASASAPDAAAEERAFSAELERFARLRAFTERLMAKREAEAFEQASQRQARVVKLQRELSEREAAMSEREFDDAVALYLKKRELTRELSVSRAKAPPATPASTP